MVERVERFEGQTITLPDLGFRCAERTPANLQPCPEGTWNERMLVETDLSMATAVCRLKHLFHRAKEYVGMHLAYVSALFNVLLSPNRRV